MTALPSTVLTLDEAAAYLRVTPDVLRLAGDSRFSENAIRARLSTPGSPEANGHCVPQVEWNAERRSSSLKWPSTGSRSESSLLLSLHELKA